MLLAAGIFLRHMAMIEVIYRLKLGTFN